MGKVLTWDNKQEEREVCVFIRGAFYHKERDCFNHNGIYYSPFSRYYVLDNETGKRSFNLSSSIKYGIVGITDGKFSFGYFSANIAKNASVYISKEKSKDILPEIALSINPQNNYADIMSKISNKHNDSSSVKQEPMSTFMPCMNVWPLIGSGYIPIKSNDSVITPTDAKAIKINADRKCSKEQYSFTLAYNSETMMGTFQDAYNKQKGTLTHKESNLSLLLDDFTFGIEYESWDGRIPTYIAANTGLIPLRDGSLRHDDTCGYEYASVVMGGSKGIHFIKRQCDALKKFTTFNEKCSMHIHIGNIPQSKESLVNLWKGFREIQDDLFTLFPSCLEKTSSYKSKDYCSKLPSVDKVTEDSIVGFLSSGKDRFNKFGGKHPLDPSNSSKWNIASRYYFCNFNPFYYTSRGTLELRISTPTYNHNKVVALLVIFATIIKEALKEKYYMDVNDLINTIEDKNVVKWLSRYCEYRKSNLTGFKEENGNIFYDENIYNDELTGNTGELC